MLRIRRATTITRIIQEEKNTLDKVVLRIYVGTQINRGFININISKVWSGRKSFLFTSSLHIHRYPTSIL